MSATLWFFLGMVIGVSGTLCFIVLYPFTAVGDCCPECGATEMHDDECTRAPGRIQ